MKKSLIIEDDDDLREVISAFLSDQDFQVLEACNGAEGIDLFSTVAPHIVFTDLKMPEVDGFTVIDTISKSAPHIPLIVISGNGVLQDSIDAIRRGAWDYVTKPIMQFTELTEVIDRSLKRAESLKEHINLVQHLEGEIEKRALLIEESNSQRISNIEELKASKQMAASADIVKTEFISNVTHELRTPLGGVLGMAGLLQESELDKHQRDCVEMILSSGELLLNLINNLLDFSDVEEGEIPVKVDTFDLAQVIKSILHSFSGPVDEKKLTMSYSITSSVPATILTDKKILIQVISMILDNAVKFTNKGSIALNIDMEGSQNFLFSVTDTGPGISDAEQNNIFDPFIQGDGSHTRSHGGTGLGLPLCIKLIEILGGTLWLDSKEDAGSTFFFTIPQI